MEEIANFIELNDRSGIPLIQQLRSQLTWVIVSGKLNSGDYLPPVRLLSQKLSINVNTVRIAYQLLAQDNLIKVRQGSGATVLPIDPLKMANRMRENRSHTIGVILPGISDPFYHSFLQGIEEIARLEQTMLFLCDAHENLQEAFRFYNKLIAKQTDGIICASMALHIHTSHIDERASNFPLVSVDWPDDVTNSVQLDLENAGYSATLHLLEHGYQRIGFITIQGEFANIFPIQHGYERAFREKGLKYNPALIAKIDDFSLTAGRNGAEKLLGLTPRPDAIFAITDVLALGAIQYTKEMGLSIPKDLGVIGVGDINLAGLVEPPLTTVALPAHKLGNEAMKMLKKLIEGEALEEKKVILPTNLVIRKSCGCQGVAPQAVSH